MASGLPQLPEEFGKPKRKEQRFLYHPGNEKTYQIRNIIGSKVPFFWGDMFSRSQEGKVGKEIFFWESWVFFGCCDG